MGHGNAQSKNSSQSTPTPTTTGAAHSVFGYPGNKAQFAHWILEQFPDHRCYVEPFGGAAGVLANKPESPVEIYNDRDGDLVQFFEVLRDRGDELVEWLTNVPYSRAMYEKWGPQWYDGWRPDDSVQRAGIFFFLRQTAFAGKYRYKGGFASSKARNQAQTFQNQVERLEDFAARFRGQVAIEHLDWVEILEKYDGEDTLFYLDPPYADTTLRYRYGENFDHEQFADALAELEASWVVSYSAVPDAVQAVGETLVQRQTKYQMASGYKDACEEVTESLVLSYDPRDRKPFIDSQSHLDQFGSSETA